jgi:hypothetical protein
MSTPLIDGFFDTPREVEGSPWFSVDEVTLSFTIKRKYAQRTATYQPTTINFPDPVFPLAIFISENTADIQGPIMWFERIFSTVPNPRVESREIPFTRPGQSAAILSGLTNLPVGWNQYGTCQPNPRLRIATVNFTYNIGPTFNAPAQSQITYNGSPVDYFGPVLVPGPYVVVANNLPVGGKLIVEQRWISAGNTSPAVLGFTWIQDINISRWKGPIWQMEVISIPNLV